MTSLLLMLLAADPAVAAESAPAPAKLERAAPAAPAPAKPEAPKTEAEKSEGARSETLPAPEPVPDLVGPPIPPADVPDDVRNAADESLGMVLFRFVLVLGTVVMLAYVSLNWGLRKLLGLKSPTMGGSVVTVLERVPLDQRRALFVVKAAGEYLLVGGTDASLGLISKLDAAEVEKLKAERPPAALTLSPFLQKLLTRKGTK